MFVMDLFTTREVFTYQDTGTNDTVICYPGKLIGPMIAKYYMPIEAQRRLIPIQVMQGEERDFDDLITYQPEDYVTI